MTDDHANLLATIAGLQEQIDSMSGQLTEVRPLQFLLPLPRARCGRGAVPRPAAPTAAAAPPPPHHHRRGHTRPLPRAAAAAAARATLDVALGLRTSPTTRRRRRPTTTTTSSPCPRGRASTRGSARTTSSCPTSSRSTSPTRPAGAGTFRLDRGSNACYDPGGDLGWGSLRRRARASRRPPRWRPRLHDSS